ncbi:MAG TPA: HAD-IA family hydrolase [Ramlibacter sp.]|jgi:putative hydrolase of the HAD superfamily|uniref:HAD family hydrolase n=1 Tax=Ramlibacter sp. TaxID=1917967 RepID=UPI002D5C9587|nr:HAD-IA family hydrolase [Ramlibacter sp.]HZY19459.1 HAD-IA family hydrolase [Ramlibacter sp.]
MLDISRVRAITLDLDDTLWPIWPTIARAEKALHDWLCPHAPMAAALFANPAALREIRNHVAEQRPELKHDLSSVRRESIRLALYRAGEDPLLADPAFEVFFAARQQVDLYADAGPALEFLAGRYPLVSLSNGNADLQRVGIGRFFRAALSAREFGVGKPDPRIFVAAAGAVDVQPEQVLHVGDDATLDVLGALNAGMQAVWVNRSEHQWPYEEQPHVTVTDLTQLCDLLR